MSFYEPKPLTAEDVQRFKQQKQEAQSAAPSANGKSTTVIEFISVPKGVFKETRQLSVAALTGALLAVLIALTALLLRL
jgi:hypothetical protein